MSSLIVINLCSPWAYRWWRCFMQLAHLNTLFIYLDIVFVLNENPINCATKWSHSTCKLKGLCEWRNTIVLIWWSLKNIKHWFISYFITSTVHAKSISYCNATQSISMQNLVFLLDFLLFFNMRLYFAI